MPFNKLLIGSVTILAMGALSTNALASQNPANVSQGVTSQASKVHENSDALQKLMTQAEQNFKLGEEYFNNGNFDLAKAAFDRAIDICLESSAEVRKDARFRSFYLDLVERIYRLQLVASQAGSDGFNQQLYEVSPLDELSKIDLTAESISNRDTIETKSYDFHFTLDSPVYQFINFFTNGKGRSTMEAGLRRSGRYRAMAERIFKEEGVPLDIIWLAQVESVWVPHALSSAAAKGIWQFIPSTGSRFGLRQDGYIDERVSPEKSTRAAARYLKFLNEFFAGDWMLAMAAYNCGEYGVDRAIARCGYADFWELYNRNLLPQETRNYVPAILAVTIIAKDPAKYGFNVQPDPAWDYDTFELNSQFDLKVGANLLGLSYETLRDLNPELKRGITPPSGYTLRLPKNTREQFEVAFAQLEPSEYVLASSRGGSYYKTSYKTKLVRSKGHSYSALKSSTGSSYKVRTSAAKKVYTGKAKFNHKKSH